MKTDLANVVAQLSLADIQALAKMKAAESKELPRLQKQRAKLAAKQAALDRKIATLSGKPVAEVQMPTQKAVQKPKAAKAVKAAPNVAKAAPKAANAVAAAKPGAAPKPQKRMKGIVDAVKKALAGGKKLKVVQILDSMEKTGFKVSNPAKAKKSIGALLIGQKKYFKKVSEGVYTLA